MPLSVTGDDFRFPYIFLKAFLLQRFIFWSAAAAAKSLQSCPTLCDPIRRQPSRLPCPWDSPGKNWSESPFPSPMHESEKAKCLVHRKYYHYTQYMNKWIKGHLSFLAVLVRICRCKQHWTKQGETGTSLMVQWLRVHLPTQGTRVWPLVWQDSTCCRATNLILCNYWVRTLRWEAHVL